MSKTKARDISKALDDFIKLLDRVEESYKSELEEFGRLIEEGKRVCNEEKSDKTESAADNPSQAEIKEILQSIIENN